MPAFKAVIDTSVMVSVAFAQQGLAKELRDMIAGGAFELVTSKEIMAELYRVLHYPRILTQFRATKEDVADLIGMIEEKATFTEGRVSVRKIKEDPSDDMFLACALEGNADYIVSRDPHLRNLKRFQGIEIVDVKTFLGEIRVSRIRT